MGGTVRDGNAMIAGMTPALDPAVWHYCAVSDTAAPSLSAVAFATFREAEGLSMILDAPTARAAGFALDMPMRRITLMVYSALDGVGLTAAVSGALAGAGIACNMVAALNHDHAFVPAADADRAMELLRALSARYREAGT